jgi:hypothetical protein
MNASEIEGQDLASNATINLFQSCLLNISWQMLATLNVGQYELCLHLFAHQIIGLCLQLFSVFLSQFLCIVLSWCLSKLLCCYGVNKHLLQYVAQIAYF